MNNILSGIKNIIFDLGNVLINIDFTLTIKAFAQLNPEKKQWLEQYTYHTDLFLQYEKGEITDTDFRKGLQTIIGKKIEAYILDKAWNALLLDFPKHRIELLQTLAPQYRLFLLSNTNAIHIKEVNNILYNTFQISELDSLFEKAYYSHHMGKRKPELAIYTQILEEKQLNPAETLFLDDNLDNILAAKQLGIQSLHIVPKQYEVKDIFAEVLNLK